MFEILQAAHRYDDNNNLVLIFDLMDDVVLTGVFEIQVQGIDVAITMWNMGVKVCDEGNLLNFFFNWFTRTLERYMECVLCSKIK